MKADDEIYSAPLELPGEPENNSGERPSKKKPKRKWLITSIILLVIIVAVLLLIFLVTRDNESSNPTNTNNEALTQEENSTPQPNSTDDIPPVTSKETFTAGRPRLSLEHPTTWKVSESDGGVTATSPDFEFKNIDGEAITGFFKIYIRQGARQEDSKFIGSGVAALPSEKLKYTEPAPGQREETNLSFFGQDSKDNFAYFFIAGNFSLKPGDTLGPDYGKEPGTFIVMGGFASKELEDDLATHNVPLDYFKTTNAYEQAIEIIKSLKLI